MVKIYPFKQLSLEQAIKMQFKLVDTICDHFNGLEILQAGDYGLAMPLRKPIFTNKVENCLAEFFDVKAAVLVRGSGTGAIRAMFMAALNPGDQILVHDGPVYKTTSTTIRIMGLKLAYSDYNKLDGLENVINENIKAVFIDHMYDRITDKYRLEEVINAVKSTKYDPLIMTDEDYAAMRVEKIGVQLGADISAFSLFKLLAPPGMGLVLAGSEKGCKLIDKINEDNYSGGCQVQGPEAMDTLRSLVYAPVLRAIQDRVVNEVCKRLNDGEVDGVDWAAVSNSHIRQILVKLKEPTAEKVSNKVWKYGAQSHLVGCESRYESTVAIVPESKRFKEYAPELMDYMLRVVPFQAGPDTVIRILKESIKDIKK